MSKKASRRRWRAFGSAFMLTLCLLILGAGCPVCSHPRAYFQMVAKNY